MNFRTVACELVAVAYCLLLPACQADRTPESLFGPSGAGELVLDGLLIVGRPLPPVFVTQTVATADRDSPGNAVAPDAVVEIRQADRVFRYVRDPDANRFQYSPPANSPVIAPDTKYEMVVTATGRTARATTITPGPFRVREGVVLDEKTEEVMQRLKTFADVEDEVFLAPENRVVYKTGFSGGQVRPHRCAGLSSRYCEPGTGCRRAGPRAVRRRPGPHGQFTGD